MPSNRIISFSLSSIILINPPEMKAIRSAWRSAERHADRIAFISGGLIKMIEDKEKLMIRFEGMNLEEIFFKLFDESE